MLLNVCSEYSVINVFCHVTLHKGIKIDIKTVAAEPLARNCTMPLTSRTFQKQKHSPCSEFLIYLHYRGPSDIFAHCLHPAAYPGESTNKHQFKAVKTPLAGYLEFSRHPQASFNALTCGLFAHVTHLPLNNMNFFLPDCIWAGGRTEPVQS